MRQGEEELKEYGASAQQSRPEANGLADSAEALDADSIGRVFRSVRPRAPLDRLRALGVPDGPDAHGPSVINATLYSTVTTASGPHNRFGASIGAAQG